MSTAVQPLRNITPFEELSLEAEDLYAEAKNWADGEPIQTQAQCDALDKLDKAIADVVKRLDALRVEEKAPLDEQVQAIQDRYNPLIQPKKGKLVLAREALNGPRAAFKAEQARIKEDAARKAREEEERLRRDAEEAIRASAGNLEAREQAEEKLALANDAAAFAKREERRATTGLGLRTTYRAELTDLNVAIKHYWAAKRDEFSTLVQQLAADDVRSGKREIPGFIIHEEKKAL